MAYTDQQVLEQCQYTMIEPPDGGQTWESELWTLEEVAGYLTQRQNRLLKDTHLQVGIANVTVIPGVFQYDLPDDWIATVRVVLLDGTGASRALLRSDLFEADHGIPTWPQVVIGTAPPPKIYTDVDTPPLTIKIMQVPSLDYTMQVFYVPLGVALDGSGEIMTVPDELVPTTIKYGVLADMFSKVGRAHDPGRAQYCQQRFELGIEVTNMLLRGFK